MPPFAGPKASLWRTIKALMCRLRGPDTMSYGTNRPFSLHRPGRTVAPKPTNSCACCILSAPWPSGGGLWMQRYGEKRCRVWVDSAGHMPYPMQLRKVPHALFCSKEQLDAILWNDCARPQEGMLLYPYPRLFQR